MARAYTNAVRSLEDRARGAGNEISVANGTGTFLRSRFSWLA
jgi:hypothetical protein